MKSRIRGLYFIYSISQTVSLIPLSSLNTLPHPSLLLPPLHSLSPSNPSTRFPMYSFLSLLSLFNLYFLCLTNSSSDPSLNPLPPSPSSSSHPLLPLASFCHLISLPLSFSTPSTLHFLPSEASSTSQFRFTHYLLPPFLTSPLSSSISNSRTTSPPTPMFFTVYIP